MTKTETVKTETTECVFCSGTGRAAAAVTSGACKACSGYGQVGDFAECWCDGTPSAFDHENH